MELNRNQQSKLIILAIAGLILFTLGNFIWRELRAAKVTIVASSPTAQILAAETRTNELVEIGVGRATYKTQNEGTLFITVQEGISQTQTSSPLVKGQTQEVNIELREAVEPEPIANAALSYVYEEGDFVFGVNANTQSLTYFTEGNGVPDVSYLSLPFIKKVEWRDSKNFVFDAFGTGSRAFINGREQPLLVVAEGGEPKIEDFAASEKVRDLLILDEFGVYVGNNGLTSNDWKRIIDVSWTPNNDYQLLSDGTQVYLVETKFSDVYKEGLPDEGLVESIPTGAIVTVISFSGEILDEFSFEVASTVNSVVKKTDTEYLVLTEDELRPIQVTGDGTATTNLILPLFFENATDLALDGDGVLIFNEGGLWLQEEMYLYKVAGLDFGQRYAPNSLQVRDDSIIFSAAITPNEIAKANSDTSNLIFSIPRPSQSQ